MGAPVPVLVNASGGTARRLGDRLRAAVEDAFAAAGVEIALELLDGRDIAPRAAALAGAPVVAVGGGDGTLGAAAGALAGTGTAMAALPLGTRNHLAAQLGIADLAGAARAVAGGAVASMDLGRVNGMAFVNNAVIGLYPDLVRQREAMAAPKWLAMLPAALGALARMRHHRLRICRPGEDREPIVTPLLFVGNGHYRLAQGVSASREAIDDGRLSLYAVASRRRLALLGFAARALAGRTDPDRDFAALGDHAAFTVEGRSRRIDVALDGEVRRLAMPLRFRSEAGALRVVVPGSEP